MKQLNFFGDIEIEKPKRKVGRPTIISPETVFAVKDDINKGLKNKNIIKKHSITERTFYRIKKGGYNYLFKKALDQEVEGFSLNFSL